MKPVQFRNRRKIYGPEIRGTFLVPLTKQTGRNIPFAAVLVVWIILYLIIDFFGVGRAS